MREIIILKFYLRVKEELNKRIIVLDGSAIIKLDSNILNQYIAMTGQLYQIN